MDDNEPALGVCEGLRRNAAEWCAGRSWLVRLPLLIFLAYIGFQQFMEPKYWSLFAPINLGIHEWGHLIFNSLGRFMGVAGGTILQLLAPLASMVMFLRQGDYFAIAVCSGWLSTNLFGVSIYMADAEKMELDLVTVGDSGGIVIHDWNYLFTQLGLLEHCEAIGWLTRQSGNFSMLACLALSGWLLWQMYALPKPARK